MDEKSHVEKANTVKVRAQVTSQHTGTAVTLEPLHEDAMAGTKHKSTHFNKFPDGSVVECIFRIWPDGREQLLSATAVDPTTTYQVFVSDFAPEHIDQLIVKLTEVFSYSAEQAEFLRGELMASTTDGKVVAITPPILYDDVKKCHDWVRGISPLEGTVRVLKSKPNALPGRGAVLKTDGGSGKSARAKRQLPNVPEWVGSHWLSQKERTMFAVCHNALTDGRHLNVFATGVSGYGKTEKFRVLGEYLGVPVIYVDCSIVLDTTEWFGYPEARDGETVFEETEFTQTIKRGNAVVILDEFNRVEPQLSNSLFPVLDHRRRTVVHNHEIVVGPGTIFCMTLNLGIQYAGTNVLDSALVNRSDMRIEVGPMPQRIEISLLEKKFPGLDGEEPASIVALVTELRKTVDKLRIDVDVSTRTSEKLANLVELGAPLADAVEFVVLNNAPIEHRKALLDAANLVVMGSPRPRP